MKTFSIKKYISSTPKTSFIIHVGHLNGNYRHYASVEFLRKNNAVHIIRPSREAVRDQFIDELVQCAIAFIESRVEMFQRFQQPSWGLEPDLIIYTFDEIHDCPICNGDLEIDEEFMQDHQGQPIYYFCVKCGKSGTLLELQQIAEEIKENNGESQFSSSH